MTQQEQWRTVPGYADYRVSDTGRVVSHKRGQARELAGFMVDGYRRLTMSGASGRRGVSVHRLVAAAFIGPCPEGMEVRHLDGNRLNNQLSNLQYGSRADNMQDRLAHGTNPQASKTHCKWGHEFTEQNTWTDGSARWCRACRRRRQRDYAIRLALRAANIDTTGAAA